MVVIVDLDDEPPAVRRSPGSFGFSNMKPVHYSLAGVVSDGERKTVSDAARRNPNVNGFSAALSCYPIASQLASQLDLNSLHHLSRTCRQFRANLLQYRAQLVKNTMHCVFDELDPGTTLPWREAESDSSSSRRLPSGKIGRCARDMVAECRRCGIVVCRNCTIKRPKHSALQARHRRLCRTCSKAALRVLTTAHVTSGAIASSDLAKLNNDKSRAFTAPAFERAPCSCDETVWLCQPCGQRLRKEDTMYIRAWTWRTRYSHYLGGVGTGAGEGNESVNCGRGPACLSGKIVEHETDCDTRTLPIQHGAAESPERWKGTSYYAQEIEGIGGVVKMKAKKHVRVGECVKIYEDERDQPIKYLKRELEGKLRSWCSWCERVIPAEDDIFDATSARSAEGISTLMSDIK